jgi:hypothetical protein
MATVTSEELLKQILAASSKLPESASNKVQRPLASADFRWKPSDNETKRDIERAKLADAEIRKAAQVIAAYSQQATEQPKVKETKQQQKQPKGDSTLKALLGFLNGDDELINKSWEELGTMRNSTSDKREQDRIAPYEHRAWAREYTKENPEAILVTPAMSVAYNVLKALGMQSGRSDPSAKAILEGTKGSIEGLGGYVRELITKGGKQQ